MSTLPLPNGCSIATLLNVFKERIKNLVNHSTVAFENDEGLVYEETTRGKAEEEAGILCDHIAYVMLENLAASNVMEQAMMDGVSFKDLFRISYLIPRMEKEKAKVLKDYQWEEESIDGEDEEDSDES